MNIATISLAVASRPAVTTGGDGEKMALLIQTIQCDVLSALMGQ
jgi:hypothetical protein